MRDIEDCISIGRELSMGSLGSDQGARSFRFIVCLKPECGKRKGGLLILCLEQCGLQFQRLRQRNGCSWGNHRLFVERRQAARLWIVCHPMRGYPFLFWLYLREKQV